MARAVVDTNVLISGVLNPRGAPGLIVQAVMEAQIDVVTSLFLLQELLEVSSSNKFSKYSGMPFTVERLANFLKVRASIVPGVPTEAVVTLDPDDDYVLACAIQGNVDYIVSGDRHLLSLAEYRGIPILSPREFVQKLKETSRG